MMLYFYVSVVYTVANLLLGLILFFKARRNLVNQFYLFCIVCLATFGILGYLLTIDELHLRKTFLEDITIFLYALIPFFFLHFTVVFLRRYDLLRSRAIIGAIYFAGLFSYAMVLRGYIPTPLNEVAGIAINGYIYYITWMSIFFSIGIAMLFAFVEGFSDRSGKSGLLLTGFALLMLVLPSPFTESIYYLIFKRNAEMYGLTSAFSLLIAIYLIFRHKIVLTLYDAVRSSLVVMNDVFILTDPKFKIQIMHGAVSQLGYSAADLLGMPLQKIIVEQYYIENYLEYVTTGRMRECLFDAEVIRKDGTRLIMDFSFSPVFENEDIAGFVGIARDVTKKKTMEQALRSSEERFRRLAENAPDIIYHYRLLPDHGYEYVSPAAEEITHYSADEFYSRPELFREMVHPEDRSVVEQYFRGEGIFGQSFMIRLITKDGRTIWTEQRTVPVYDEKGYRVAMEGIIRDITERVELEQGLREAQKFESIGILAGGIAHDFNNILGIILGYTQALKRYPNSPEKLEHDISMVETAVQRGAGIVRELLMIARKTESTFAPVDLHVIVEDLLRLLSDAFPRTIDISIRLMRNAPVVNADKNQIHQAIMNLCLNARDAMPNGGILSIADEIVPRELLESRFPDITAQAYLKMTVADTGFGMSEDVRQHLFEPFFTTKSPGKGTGLGLAVVYGIVKNHGGFITVDSELNVGTIFSLYFPLEVGAQPAKGEIDESPAQPAGGSETILLVEDESSLIDLVSVVLKDSGYRVIEARNGDEALQMFAKHRDEIDAVITDMGLPKHGGWEIGRQMLEQKKSVRIVFASGYFEPHIMDEMSKAGMKYFVQKPYNPTELLTILRQALDAPVPVHS